MATTLRFVILDEHRGNGVREFERSLNSANKAVDRNNAALKSQGKSAAAAEGGILSLAGAVSGFGEASTAASSKSSLFAKSLAAVNLATGVLEPAMAGVVVATGALAAATAAAGAGVAAYGIALKPVLGQVSDLMKAQAAAATGGKAAQKQYQQMLKSTPPLIVAFAKEVKNAQNAYQKWAVSLSGATLAPLQTALSQVRPVLHAIRPLVLAAAGAFETLVTQLSHKIEAGGLQRVVQTLLPHVRPVILNLAHAVGNLVAGFYGVIKAFLPMSDTITGGVVKLTAKFKEWGQSLPSHSGFQALMNMFRTQTPLAVGVLKNLAVIIGNVARATVGLASPANSKALLQILTPLTQVMVQLTRNQGLVRAVIYFLLLRSALVKVRGAFLGVQTGLAVFTDTAKGLKTTAGVLGRVRDGFTSSEAAASAFSGTAGTIGGKLRTVTGFLGTMVASLTASSVSWVRNTAVMVAQKAVSLAVAAATKVMAAAQWLLNVAMDANPIGLIVIALAALAAAFYLAWTRSATFRKILIAAWKDIKDGALAVWHWFDRTFIPFFTRTIPAAFKTVLTWVKRNWPWLLGALTGPIGLAVVFIIKHWRTLVSTITGLFNSLRRTVATVWDTIWRNTVTRVRNGVTTVVGWFRGLPGRVLGALRGLGHSLYAFAHAALNEFWSGFKSVATGVLRWIGGFVGRIVGAVKRLLHIGSPSAVFHDIGVNMMLGLERGIKASAHRAANAAQMSVGNIKYRVGAGVTQWGPLVRRALLMEGLNPLLAARVMYQMQTESGGNPNAINLTDINAQHGDPSRGLMQVIGSTFRAYHWPGTSWNIYNPLANIAAALRYARARYGPTLMSGGMGIGSGHGYALGTPYAAAGWAWVGERGPELMRFRGGEQVRRAGSAPVSVTYNISIAAPLGVNRAAVGREVVHAIKEYERSSGAGWRR